MLDRPFKTFCPSNYCIDNERCVFVDDSSDTLPTIRWNADFSPMSLNEMRESGYHHVKCEQPCTSLHVNRYVNRSARR
jgi:hypothetical protein